MPSILETERLLLREFSFNDVSFIIELLNSPGWMKYIGDRNVRTTGEAIRYIQNGPFKSYKKFGYGLWIVELKTGMQPIGICGLMKRDYLDSPDLGFAFLAEFQGKGYAYEIAGATMEYALYDLMIPKISAITLPNNFRSINLLRKTGFEFVSDFCVPVTKEELQLFCMEKNVSK